MKTSKRLLALNLALILILALLPFGALAVELLPEEPANVPLDEGNTFEAVTFTPTETGVYALYLNGVYFGVGSDPFAHPTSGTDLDPYVNPTSGSDLHPTSGSDLDPYVNPTSGSDLNPTSPVDLDPYVNPASGWDLYPTSPVDLDPYVNPASGWDLYPTSPVDLDPYVNPASGWDLYPTSPVDLDPYVNPASGSDLYPTSGSDLDPYVNPTSGSDMHPTSGPDLDPYDHSVTLYVSCDNDAVTEAAVPSPMLLFAGTTYTFVIEGADFARDGEVEILLRRMPVREVGTQTTDYLDGWYVFTPEQAGDYAVRSDADIEVYTTAPAQRELDLEQVQLQEGEACFVRVVRSYLTFSSLSFDLATEPTAPTQPTEPTAPTEPTVPDEPTQPTGTGEPTDPDEPTTPPEPTVTDEPTTEPTAQPTTEPTAQPTTEPTAQPTTEPTAQPTTEPTAQPTAQPTAEPTAQPTKQPTKTDDSKPSDSKPSDSKPADTKPADTKPADTKPADTKPADTKPSPKPVSNPFTDVASGDYFYDPVLWALNHDPQITDGMTETTFVPGDTCTRGQVVTFLWRAMGCQEPTSKNNPFADVAASDYFYKAVLWAVEKGITDGTSDTTFSPADPCTRAHVVTFLWRTEDKPDGGSKNPFNDVTGGEYFTDAVLWAVAKAITDGTSDTTFSPADPCTRGQIVTFLYRDMK